MRQFRSRPASWALTAAVVFAPGLARAQAEAQADAILACQLNIADGEPAKPPETLFLRVSPDTYEDFRDGAWGRNFCGSHGGGAAPEAYCYIDQGAFRLEWKWKSDFGRMERHVLLDLKSGELTDSDQNGLERKGVCKPAADPAAKPPAKPPTGSPATPAPAS